MNNDVTNEKVIEEKDSSINPMESAPLESSTSAQEENEEEDSAEKTLKTLATIVLAGGVFMSCIMMFTITVIEIEGPYHKEYEFSYTGFALTIGTLLSTLIAWSVMKVLANISLTLKDIKKNKAL
jgi:hypothetical protein